MARSNPRVFELLEEILNSGRTPEEVCADCPKLLGEVRRRWHSFRLIDDEVAALLPDSATRRDPEGTRPLSNPAELPQIPGYHVEGVLGAGGMGVVYRAWHLRLNRPVALKMLLVGAHAQPTELERFLREAEAVAGLRHPNIVQVYDVGDVDGRPYFTMELIEGGDLTEKVQGVPQPARQAATLIATLADAIHVAHQAGIVHRDLKPGNILFTPPVSSPCEGGVFGGCTPKVTDFGLALRLQGERACATDRDQQDWVLALVRRADPNPWRGRVRDPAIWDDPAALKELADRVPLAEQSPQLLVVLGARFRAKQLDAVDFLERVASAYPGDFWVNVETGNALCDQSKWVEAIGYYRTALALRPETLSLRYTLGDLYVGQRRWDGAIAEYEQAGRLDPGNAWRHNRLGFALAWKGSGDEAIVQFREAIRIDANNGWSHFYLAIALENKGHHAEAADEFGAAARLLPEKHAESSRGRRALLLKLGRGADARAAWKEELAANPPKHDDWFGYAELCLFQGDEAEYRRARRDLLAQFGATKEADIAERTGRACLLLPAPEGEFEQAMATTDHAVAVQGGNSFFLFAQGLARYRQGRFDDAIKLMNGGAAPAMGPCPRLVLAMAQYKKDQKNEARKTLAAAIASNDWTPAQATNHDVWIAHILRREAEALIQRDPAGR